jgi:hypothetical protein
MKALCQRRSGQLFQTLACHTSQSSTTPHNTHETLTIHNRPLPILARRKSKTLEHVQTRNRNALTPFIPPLRPRLLVPPMIPRTSIQQHRNEEQIDQSTRDFHVVGSVRFPFADKIGYARDVADFEVLPSAVRGDRVEVVGAEIPL